MKLRKRPVIRDALVTWAVTMGLLVPAVLLIWAHFGAPDLRGVTRVFYATLFALSPLSLALMALDEIAEEAEQGDDDEAA